MNLSELDARGARNGGRNKGILAADESSGTIKKRFDGIKLERTEEHRRSYREMLFTAPGATESISGVILYDETLRQKTRDGMPFPEYLDKLGIIPGIKVDIGRQAAGRFPGETITEGLDGLRERLIEYYKLGARFAKWRAVIDIAEGIPTPFAIEANAHALARYAALCQEQDIVPIVEPEVLMDGAHSHRALRGGHRCDAASRVRSAVRASRASRRHGAQAEHGDLGQEGCQARERRRQVAEATVRCLKRHVPAAVPGIAFLSGGQSSAGGDPASVAHEQARAAAVALTFSYGRALQDTALKAWGGSAANFAAGQKEFAQAREVQRPRDHGGIR